MDHQVVGIIGSKGSTGVCSRKAAIFVLVVLMCVFGWCFQVAAAGSPFAPLKAQLIKEGYPRAFVNALYDQKMQLQPKTVAGTMRIRESRLNYAQFLEPEAVRQAQHFVDSHRRSLAQAEAAYGVDPYVIAGILLVESRFGGQTGRTPVLAVLSTFALMRYSSYRDIIWKRMRPQDRKRWDRARFDTKLEQRAVWAMQEVKALLRCFEDEPTQLKTLRGSVMGAMGWPQFLPSSLVRYGVDGDGNGTIDLFAATDSIHSIANYLKAYGWDPQGTEKNHRAVLYEYNHSDPYVTTILEIARELRERAKTGLKTEPQNNEQELSNIEGKSSLLDIPSWPSISTVRHFLFDIRYSVFASVPLTSA